MSIKITKIVIYFDNVITKMVICVQRCLNVAAYTSICCIGRGALGGMRGYVRLGVGDKTVGRKGRRCNYTYSRRLGGECTQDQSLKA